MACGVRRPAVRSLIGALGVLVVALMLVATLASPAAAQPRKHALLIGIGEYEYAGALDGPRHDVGALARALEQDWGFQDIRTLVDQQATRAAILGAIDDLVQDTPAGDFVFVYFSGHGTSFDDRRSKTALPARLDPATGGLYPADLNPRAPDAFEQLIVGRRDLRPRFLALERGRDVFVVFDACFSGSTVRAFPRGQAKNEAWAGAVPPEVLDNQSVGGDEYPYENLVYLSASAADETAWDIPESLLSSMPTIDGRPHGALTNALLRGLAGDANTNNEAQITVRELHAFVRRQVVDEFQQTPQLLPVGRLDLLDRPVFAIARGVRPVTSERPSSLRLLLGEGAEDLRDRLSRLDGVTLVRGEHDVRVDAAGAGYTLRHGSGDSLAERLSAGDVAIRLERHRFVYELLGVRFPAAVFNVYLELAEMRDGLPGPMTRSELVRGTKYAFNYEADVAAYFLLVSADRDGRLSLLAPWDASDLQPQLSRLIPDIVVTGNPGTEFVKLFGFSRRPEGLEAWMPSADANGRLLVRHIEPDSGQLDELLRFVRAASGFAAETVVKLVSIEP